MHFIKRVQQLGFALGEIGEVLALRDRGAAPCSYVTAPKRRRKAAGDTTTTALPAGHASKKATGEIGRIQSVDAKAGTARVHWLKLGAASTVPLSAISRR